MRLVFQSLLSWITLTDVAFLSPAELIDLFQSLLSWITLTDGEEPRAGGGRLMQFQSLLSWITLTNHPPRRASIRRRPGFNPCCRGSPSPTSVRRSRRASPTACFNPCCRGSPSPTRHLRHVVLAGRDVSILVVVDHPHRQHDKKAGNRQHVQVSILVVVDHPHRPCRSRRIFQKVSCFNPCCRGSPSPTSVMLAAPAVFGQSFNPCCRGSPSPTKDMEADKETWKGFQSLLSWITLTDTTRSGTWARPRCRFNPCCRGSPSPTQVNT